MSNPKSWWSRKTPDSVFLLFGLIMVAIGLLLLSLLFVPFLAHADACLAIDVPPQAVLGNPDGDTVHLWNFAPGGKIKIRVKGINTPERNEPGWAEAKKFTAGWLARGPFKVLTCGKPTLDRIEASVERNGESLASALLAAGYSR